MANLTCRDKSTLEELFVMGSGYVLEFSNNSFQEFVQDVIGIDIYYSAGYEGYCSKANKLRQIWRNESDDTVGILLEELLLCSEKYHTKNGELDKYKKKIEEMRVLASKLKGIEVSVQLPKKPEETLQTLMEDINNALARHKPELVLDRLHTYSTKLLRKICKDNNIETVDDKGNNLPLHNLAGLLKKKYESYDIFQSTFTIMAIQNSISLFDRYNNIRNDKSYAHDNEILDKIEADFAVRIMADFISFIDKAETYRKKVMEREISLSDMNELLF